MISSVPAYVLQNVLDGTLGKVFRFIKTDMVKFEFTICEQGLQMQAIGGHQGPDVLLDRGRS